MKQIFRSSVIILLVLFCYHNSFAALKIHNWLENHRGYSIELVPGTGGTTGLSAEYVAAGTVYDGANPSAWHFMHLDANGIVIDERTASINGDFLHEFKVVDIACESGNAFRITIQGRSFPTSNLDYIYIAGVDITGADLPPANNPNIVIAGNSPYRNLYPTHSYFATNGFLYVCGYATPDTEYPMEPNATTPDKIGMFLKVNVNAASPSVPNSYFWNTPGNSFPVFGNPLDYDMALKIAPYQYGQEFPLLVTGATNDGFQNAHNISNALVASFTPNAVPVNMASIFPTPLGSSTQNNARGIYGIDIRGGVYGGDNGSVLNPDVAVLVNFFGEPGEDDLPARAYGIARVKNDHTERAVGNSLVYTRGLMHAKQFLELHGNGVEGSSNNHIYIVGETMGFNCDVTLPSGTNAPSNTNVSPFISLLHFGPGFYSYTSGFNPSMTTPIPNNVYLSSNMSLYSQSTNASNMDYLNGSGVGLREDITRLYTFASLERHYNDPLWGPNPPVSEPAMVIPVAENTSPDLKTKFLGLSNTPPYTEPVCENQTEDCQNRYYMEINTRTDHFSQIQGINLTVGILFSVTNSSYQPTYWDCYLGQGNYKSGRTTGVIDATGNTTFEVYPNPAHKTLNINFGAMQGKFSISLTDALGKIVLQQDGKAENKVTLSLPGLSPGMYMVTIVTEKSTQTNKITIQ